MDTGQNFVSIVAKRWSDYLLDIVINKTNVKMQNSNFWPYFFFGLVVLHFIVGFGYLAYKMSSKQKGESVKKNDED
jgi:hypothetical protein